MFPFQATGSLFSGPWPRTGKSKIESLVWLTSNRDFNNPIPDWKPPVNNDLVSHVTPMADQNAMIETETASSGEASTSSIEWLGVSLFKGRFRWVICGLLFFGVTKNYMDRQVLGVLKGPLQHEFGWNEIDYGNLVFSFQAAYALGMILVGRLIDRLGTRIGYAMAMFFWSLASMGHAIAFSLPSFVAARAALGFGEAGVFPASIKCVAEWLPKKRAGAGNRNLQRRDQHGRN